MEFLRWQGFMVLDPDPDDSAIVKAFGLILSKEGGNLFNRLEPRLVEAMQEVIFQSYDRAGVKPNFRGGQRRMIFLNTIQEFIKDSKEKYNLRPEDVLMVSLIGDQWLHGSILKDV